MLPARTSPPLQPGECSDGSEQARHISIEPGMITPNITALSPGMGVVRDVPGGSVLQCVYAVLHSSGQAFPSTTSAGGEGLATVVEGGGGIRRAP